MRILFLCHRIPYPPDKGEKIRAFHQLRALAARHEVDVFTLADDAADLRHEATLAQYCERLTVARVFPRLARVRSLPYLLTRTPLTLPYFSSAELHARVRHALAARHYDRIYVYCSAMAQYVPWATPQSRVAGLDTDIPVIVDLVDVDSDKWAQYASARRFPLSAVFAREGRHLRDYERLVCERASWVLVSTEREAALASEVAPGARIRVVPNGVDTAYFAPAEPLAPPENPCVIFTGDMSYFPNAEGAIFFARQVLPLVRSALPQTRFLVVGRSPGRSVEALRDLDGVEVTGFVQDIRPWLRQASVAVAPLRIAAGVQNKILEAMSSGLPVVATRRAVQGLSARVAALVETGETADEIAAEVLALLREPEGAFRRGLEGRQRVMADYSWDAALARLLLLVESPGATSDDRRAGAVTAFHDFAAPRP